ncbi:hypothetical protein MFLAVUS_007131 [Mucor flavus]|uniref:Uncharacterized protein n=1 Tax=Mucor flavus TaxID=439312 RepID=A0ABP9Z3E9_9FUNG
MATYPAATVTPELFSLTEMYGRQTGLDNVLAIFNNPVMLMLSDREANWRMRDDIYNVIPANCEIWK